VNFDTPYFKGCSKVLCLKNPIVDVLIGNVINAFIEDRTLDNPILDSEINCHVIDNTFLVGFKMFVTSITSNNVSESVIDKM